MKYELVIIGVNYCSSEQTLAWVKSIRADSGTLIAVVDTSAEKTDPELEKRLRETGKNVMYLNAGENLGYFGGARYGLKWLTEKEIAFDALIVSNVDLRFETENPAGIIGM